MERWHVDASMLEEIALGAAFLGSGGGGDVAFDLPSLAAAIKTYGAVEIYPFEHLTQDALIVPIGFIGAPIAPSGQIAGQKELACLIESISDYFDRMPDVLMPLEIGGGNGLTPLIHSPALKIPVLDADLIGRAYPELHMTRAAMCGISAAPCFLADASGRVVIIKDDDPKVTETKARSITSASGSVMALSTYFMRAFDAREALVLGSYSLAKSIGEVIKNGCIPGTKVHSGIIDTVDLHLDCGFLRGTIQIDGAIIFVQNEYLVAKLGPNTLAATPEIIAVIDEERGGVPLSIEAIEEGKMVSIYSYRAPECWTSEEGMKRVGPEAFTFIHNRA